MSFSCFTLGPIARAVSALLCMAALSCQAPSALAQSKPPAHCRAELVSGSSAVAPGQSLLVAVILHPDPGWHTYWSNPGDAGQATELHWTLPKGFTAGPILWPVPHLIDVGGVVSYGYEGETALLVRIHAPANLPSGRSLSFKAAASWLVCSNEECLPGHTNLSLTLPQGSASPAPYSLRLERLLAGLPRSQPLPQASCRRDGGRIVLSFATPSALKVDSAHFFPSDSLVIDDSAPQSSDPEKPGLLLKAASSQHPAQRLRGLVVFSPAEGQPVGYPVDLPIQTRQSK